MKLFEIKKGEVARCDTSIGIFPIKVSDAVRGDDIYTESFFNITKKWYGTTVNQFYEYKKDNLITTCNKSNRLTNWLSCKLLDYIDYCKPEQPINTFIFQAFNLKIGNKKNWTLTLEFHVDVLKSYKQTNLANRKHNIDFPTYYYLKVKSIGTDSDFLSSNDAVIVVKKLQSMHSIFLKEIKASSFEDLKKIESLEYTITDSMYFSTKKMDISCFFT